MPIPHFHEMLLPVLRRTAAGREWTIAFLRSPIADDFGLTDAERQELLPSNTQSRFVNRLCWVKIYQQWAGLIDRVRRNAFISPAERYASLSPAPSIASRPSWHMHGDQAIRPGMESTHAALRASY